MPTAEGGSLRPATILARAAREIARAERARAIAELHERLLLDAPERRARTHNHAALLHREAEARHRGLAQIYERLAASQSTNSHAGLGDALRAPDFLAALGRLSGAQQAAVTLRTPSGNDAHLASSRRARAALDLEYVLGEGPVNDCRGGDTLVARQGELDTRWPVYGPEVTRLGLVSVAATPLVLAGSRLGSIVLFGLSPDASAQASRAAVCEGAAAFLGIVAGDSAATGSLEADDFDFLPVVHQASGIVAIRRGCTVADALALLRARAFATDRPLQEVAITVVDSKVF